MDPASHHDPQHWGEGIWMLSNHPQWQTITHSSSPLELLLAHQRSQQKLPMEAFPIPLPSNALHPPTNSIILSAVYKGFNLIKGETISSCILVVHWLLPTPILEGNPKISLPDFCSDVHVGTLASRTIKPFSLRLPLVLRLHFKVSSAAA
jgi:hypothetical protein